MRWLGRLIRDAVLPPVVLLAIVVVVWDRVVVTYDLKPTRDDPSAVGTSEYADAIIERLR